MLTRPKFNKSIGSLSLVICLKLGVGEWRSWLKLGVREWRSDEC